MVPVSSWILGLPVTRTVSLKFTVTSTVCPILYVPSGVVDETDDTVGNVLSKLTDDALVVLLTGVPAFDARSENEIENDTVPSVSPDCIWYVADHDEFAPDTLAECPAMVTVGVWMFSDELNDTVMVSPGLALTGFALSDDIEMDESVGSTVSTTIFLLAPSEPAAPGDGRASTALFRSLSFMVPPFSPSESVAL